MRHKNLMPRHERCAQFLYEIRNHINRGEDFNYNALTQENNLDKKLFPDAIEFGFITKNGDGYKFNKPITPENIKQLLKLNSEKTKEKNKIRREKKVTELESIQKEIWTATLIPDVNFDDLKPQRINPITIDELISDMENLWVKFNEYAKIQKP